MAAFEEGVQYGLSAHGHSSENKSLVFVKLTDSSFKAIEEYLRIKVRQNCLTKKGHTNMKKKINYKKKRVKTQQLRMFRDVEKTSNQKSCVCVSVCVCVCVCSP